MGGLSLFGGGQPPISRLGGPARYVGGLSGAAGSLATSRVGGPCLGGLGFGDCCGTGGSLPPRVSVGGPIVAGPLDILCSLSQDAACGIGPDWVICLGFVSVGYISHGMMSDKSAFYKE